VGHEPPKKNGRPPLDATDPSVLVAFRLPGRQYDALYQRAQRERVPISDLIRRRVNRDDDADDD